MSRKALAGSLILAVLLGCGSLLLIFQPWLALGSSVSEDTLETFFNMAESLVELYKETGNALISLQNQINEISHKTGIDISNVITKVDELHTTFSSQKIEKIATFLDSMKKVSESSKKVVDQYVE